MTLTRLAVLSILFGATTATSGAQVQMVYQPSSNTSTTVDFDAPAATVGPIAPNDPFFTSQGIDFVNPVGGWVAAGDLLTAASNVDGAGVVVSGGVLTIGVAGDPLDEPGANAGIDIGFSAPHDELGIKFTDQSGFLYSVQLFAGTTSLGTGEFYYGGGGFPYPGVFFRGSAPADRMVITFPAGTGGVGFDEITFGDGPPDVGPVPDNCLETFFQGGNQGNQDGIVFFDLTTTQPVTIGSLLVNYDATPGLPVNVEVYTTPDTRLGKETDISNWTLAGTGDGTAVAAGRFQRTQIDLVTPFTLPAGTVGVALVAIGGAHNYTNGNGSNETATSADGVMTLTNGGAANDPFTTGTVFQPRIWNGRICPIDASIGTNYCTATANSTGAPGAISAEGSTVAANNDLVLTASNLPNQQFGIFIVSAAQSFIPGVNGTSNGNLCLGGLIGRYSQPGQIQPTGSAGGFSLQINLGAIPQGAGGVPTNPGQTWNFQAWHRDGVGLGSNLTDGISITFQ